jgi:uncharacterized protein DUF4259
VWQGSSDEWSLDLARVEAMGAWGTAAFDNDDAADFANEIEDAGSLAEVQELLDRALTTVLGSVDFLDSPDAGMGVAAAALVAAWDNPDLLCERAYSLEEWPRFDGTLPDVLRARAGQALDRVLRPGDDNELFLLWDEAGEWDQVVTDIRRYRAELP